jgi:hypothetical protein
LFRTQPIVDKSLEDYQPPNNYDMTILHMNIDDDEGDNSDDDNSIFATKTSTHQKKTIPQWARSKLICHSIK